MLSTSDNRTINALVDEVLATLRKNLIDHRAIVAEARQGYLALAKAMLQERLEIVETGRLVGLNFDIDYPENHAKEYETVIKMLEMHKAAWEGMPDNKGIPATITLKAVDVQRFVLNDWSWMNRFLTSNAGYSSASRQLAIERGLM